MKPTPKQEAHGITAALVRDYMDQGQPHNDYDPTCGWNRVSECKGGKRRADAVARALVEIAEASERKARGGR